MAGALAFAVNSTAPKGLYISPWIDGAQDKSGAWSLPEYPCEIQGLWSEDPRNRPWIPGEWTDGVDNVEDDPLNPGNQIVHGPKKLYEGSEPPPNFDVAKLPPTVQALAKVPHMPGQPLKEMFARMKALDARPFEDRHFDEIYRDMPESWPHMLRLATYAEGFGIHTESSPAEWAGQEDELVPSAYTTPRPDTVTLCVGIAGLDSSHPGPATVEIEGAEYDYLEFLYAKDQEDKLITIMQFENRGIYPSIFNSYSFVPPKGTTSITPYACFKIRGVWAGTTIEWDESVGSEEMAWFTEMTPEERLALTDKKKMSAANQAQCDQIRYAKNRKAEPVLWPENSWEGNCAKARHWDAMNN
jgi:hypothetical protein